MRGQYCQKKRQALRPLHMASAESGEYMANRYASYDGYGENYRTLLPKLQMPGLIENACRLGARAEGSCVRISFLGRDYLINHEGVEAADGQPSDSNSRGVLIFYATSEGAGDLCGEFALLNRLTGMIDGQNNLTGDMMTAPLLREFGHNYTRFAAAMTQLGGEEQPTTGSGKHVWRLRVLPKIMAQLIYYEADDEFPTDIQIMFDKTAPRFLEFECLAFLTGCMSHAIIRAGRSLEKPQPYTDDPYPL